MLEQLQRCSTREEGVALLTTLSKRELLQLDSCLSSSYTKAKIIDILVQLNIGSRLNSIAIQTS